MRMHLVLLFCLLACGCGKTKTTEELIQELKSGEEKDRVAAARLLPQRKQDVAQVVPALIDALKDREADVRRSAALGLSSFGTAAEPAITALQAAQKDKDVRVSKAAGIALSHIDPQKFPVK